MPVMPYLTHRCRAIFSKEPISASANRMYHECIFIGYVSGASQTGSAWHGNGIYLCQCGLRWDTGKVLEGSTTYDARV